MTAARQSAALGAHRAQRPWYRRGGWLLALGAAAFAVAMAGYVAYVLAHPSGQWMRPVDLRVYADGGLIVRHVRPLYHPHFPAPLYDWPGYRGLNSGP